MQFDFSTIADSNPWTDSQLSAIGNGVQVIGGECKTAAGGLGGFVTNDTPTLPVSAQITLDSDHPSGDPIGPALLDANGNGYWLRCHYAETRIRLVNNGIVGALVGAATNGGSSFGDTVELAIDSSGGITSKLNGTVLETVTDTTHAANTLRGGFISIHENNNAAGAVQWSATGYTASDTTPPNLSNGTASAVSQTQIDGSFDTDTGEGTAYVLASANATETVADVKANGAQQAVIAAGTQNFSITGLSGGQQYYVHVVHTDVAGNDSAVLSIGPVTTQSATLQLQLSGIASVTGVQFDLLDGPVGSSNTLLISGTFDVAADGSVTIDLNSVPVTNGQTLEGIAVHPSTNDPIPLQGTVTIA